MDIGEKIRKLRIERGLTQEELADRAELSKGFISQVERDLTSPSISTLEDVLTCLGTDLSTFFSEKTAPKIVFSEDDYFVKDDERHGSSIEWIVPNAQKNAMEPVLLKVDAGGRTIPDNPHEGEELGYVLRGRIELHLGSAEYEVKKGETFYMLPEEEHFISSEKGAEVIWVSCPPSF
jgi:transcriptional regulator with XRE-family HTH domain